MEYWVDGRHAESHEGRRESDARQGGREVMVDSGSRRATSRQPRSARHRRSGWIRGKQGTSKDKG